MSPFTIPNSADAGFADQSEPDKVDLDIITAAIGGTVVLSGCAVTAQAIPDLTVAVAAGVVKIGTSRVSVAAGNVVIAAAAPTNPRFDLIAVDNAGTKSRVAGTAAANPVFPAIPANSIILAAVYVPALDLVINSNQITDKRCIAAPSDVFAPGQVIGPYGLREWDDFLDSTVVTVTSSYHKTMRAFLSGTGAQLGTQVVFAANHPGAITFESGTTTTGTAAVNMRHLVFGAGRGRVGIWLRTSASLSALAERYEIFAGFTDSAGGSPVDAVYFRYRDDINGGKWQAKAVSNSVATDVDTGITVAADTWYRLEVEVNAAGDEAKFYIGVADAAPTLVATITTNIPTGTTRDTLVQLGIAKSLGTTNRVFYLDAFYLELDFTTAR